jgi:hypothetical protein
VRVISQAVIQLNQENYRMRKIIMCNAIKSAAALNLAAHKKLDDAETRIKGRDLSVGLYVN